jgi:hypothetical protein
MKLDYVIIYSKLPKLILDLLATPSYIGYLIHQFLLLIKTHAIMIEVEHKTIGSNRLVWLHAYFNCSICMLNLHPSMYLLAAFCV